MKEIRLFCGKVCLVDDEDYEKLSLFKWYSVIGTHTIYAHRYLGNRKYILMHREIMKSCLSQIDHLNGNGLDNRKENLRFATSQQNAFNRKKDRDALSRFKGVSFDKHMVRSRPWRAYIRKDNKAIYLGYYRTEQEAAMAYDNAAERLFGTFAKTNKMMGVL